MLTPPPKKKINENKLVKGVVHPLMARQALNIELLNMEQTYTTKRKNAIKEVGFL